MEVQQTSPQEPPMTFDEVSMERSKNFVKALQELKNLRPQLHSAAEYCEKSYLHSEQKQMVLDNLKDYVVRALVNAVDHLGTVACKLTDLLEQQTSDISTMELKASCLNQQLLTCRIYTDKEGLRQQQLLAFIPRHHKHYILPNSTNKKVHFSPYIQTEPRQSYLQARPRLHSSENPASKTLSWHLATETNPMLNGSSHSPMSSEDAKPSLKTSDAFHLLDAGDIGHPKSAATHLSSRGTVSCAGAMKQSMGVNLKDVSVGSKRLAALKSIDHPHRHEIVRAPISTKSMLSAFFVKQKTRKMKHTLVS